MEPKQSVIPMHETSNIEEAEPEDDPLDHIIIIDMGEIIGLKPVYPLSDIVLSVTFGDDTLFISEKTPMSERISIEQYIHLAVNRNDLDMINKLISLPLVFSLLEYPVAVQQEIITETNQGNDAIPGQGKLLWRSEESILDLEEALFGQKSQLNEHEESKTQQKKGSKTKSKSSKSSQGSKTSKASKKTGKSKEATTTNTIEEPEPAGPQVAGTASIDISSLFFGETSIEQNLIMKTSAGQPLDDRRISAANLPFFNVSIHIDHPIPPCNMLYYTLESIYNLPKVMAEKMEYKLMIGLPTNTIYRLVPFENYEYTEKPREQFDYKKFYGTSIKSSVAIRDDFDDVKWGTMDYESAFVSDVPRLEFNVMKGERITDDEIDNFKTKVSQHRCIGLEMYMVNPDVMGSIKSKASSSGPSAGSKKTNKPSKKGSKKESKKGSKAGRSSKGRISESGVDKPEEEYLHLMAFIDICRLLYPGEQQTRVACELRTFNMQEFEAKCGQKDSYFRPKPPPPEPAPRKSEPSAADSTKDKSSVVNEKKSKKSKSSKSSKDTKKEPKKEKEKGSKKGQGDLKAKLPKVPPPPQPSEPVYNEQGYPTFIIMEFEFRFPLNPKREPEDLHDELDDILEQYVKSPDEPRIFKSKYVSEDLFQNSVKALFQDLKQHYREYISQNGKAEDVMGFVTFLTESEKYQVYLNTLTKYASMYSSVTKNFDPGFTKDEYHAFIGEIYVDLIDLLNTTLGHIGTAGDEYPDSAETNVDDLLFYAKEATEIDALGLAQHYYLKRISSRDTSATYWLDYAVYKLQIEEVDAALECAIEALKHDPGNRDCLLLFALLQARKGCCPEAETCLLNITLDHPRWLEGWMSLYCVYLHTRNYEGMEVCMEMAEKFSKEHVNNPFIDLSWCGATLPNKFIFKAVKYLINLRLLEEAELLLAEELYQRNTDMMEYLLAVLCMLKRQFEHALSHIDQSFKMGHCTYDKNIVRGHIFLGLNKLDCALVEYEKILHSTKEVPFDESIYLVYIRAGLCYSALGMHQSARKILLKACEKRGTPYSWLATGVLYFHQHDFLSADECLRISNTLDNGLPETWAYLTLVNFKIGRPNEATSCYQQAIKQNLQNEELLATINGAIAEYEDESPK